MIIDKIVNCFVTCSKKENFTDLQIEHLKDKISEFVAGNKPILIVFPAFHGKVPNPKYVSGNLPDYGDYLGVQVIANLAREIENIYAPGMVLFVLHEGHFYTDTPLVGTDDDVSEYVSGIREIFDKYDFIRSITIDEIMQGDDARDNKKRRFLKNYAQNIESVDDVRDLGGSFLDLYTAYKTMYTEIHLSMGDMSRNQAKKLASKNSLIQISRYLGYAKLVKEYFGENDFIKFTVINKTSETAFDIPISYFPNSGTNGTPLLNAVCFDCGFRFVKAADAIADGYQKISRNGFALFMKPLDTAF